LTFEALTKQIHRQRASQAENAAGLSVLPLLSSTSHRNTFSSLSLSYDVASPPPFPLPSPPQHRNFKECYNLVTVTFTLSYLQTYTRAHTHLVDSSNFVCTSLVQAKQDKIPNVFEA
jgi:hypothetical protein